MSFWDTVPFLEISSVILILAFAVIPMVGIYWNSALEADLAASSAFAQKIASQTMSAVLDSLPFSTIQVSSSKISDLDGKNPEDAVARIMGPTKAIPAFLSLLGNKNVDTYARGELTDERNLLYKTKLFVFPVPVLESVDLDKEIAFTYLPRPVYENAVNVTGKPCWFSDEPFVSRDVLQLPYDLPVATVTQNATLLGAPLDYDGRRTMMKRLLFRVRWKDPNGYERQVEVVSAKSNLTSEDIK